MNNSPFEIFRRNLKPMMVFLTGLALFAFVVLPVVDTYMRRGMYAAGEGVVARFNDTALTSSRVDYFTRNHQSTVRFLVELAELTIARGGYPRTAGFRYDEQNGQVLAIGINQSPSTDSTIRTFMLASEATKAGFDLDDSSLRLWLERYTDGMISNNDIDALLMQSTQHQMGRPHLYEQLRNHLLASAFLARGYATLFMGEGPMTGPLITPQEQWANFLKLNRTAVAKTYGVLVQDYLDQTDKNPSEAEILATYEQGKDIDPNDQSPEPAFHRRYSAKFEYLVGNYQDFLNAEIAKLSEEQIRAEYERRLKGGDFQLPENAASEMLKELQGSEQKQDEPTENAPDGDQKTSGTTEAESASETPADQTASPAAESGKADSNSDAAASEKQEAGDDAGTNNPQSRVNRVDAVRLVALQAEDEKEADSQGQSSSDAEATTAKQDDSAQASQGDKPEGETSQTTPAKTTPAATEKKQDEEEAKQPAAPDNKDSEKQDTTPKVESFEEVRDQIAEDMAGPAARQRMDSVVNQIYSEMQLYFKKLALYDSYVKMGKPAEEPVRPDLEKLAAELGMTHEVIGPYDEVTIAEEPIANSRDVGTQFGGRGPGFSVIMYGFNNGQTELPKKGLFVPVRTADDPAGKIYVSWKIDETQAYTPTLSEARDEVVMAIRMKEARKLARTAAEEIARLASAESNKSLEEIVPEDKRDNIVEAGAPPAQPFKWLDMIPGFGVAPGNVPELDSVGNEFMEAVFNTEIGHYAVAPNDPQRVFYVVEPIKIEPSLEDLRAQYEQPINRMMATFIGNDSGGILADFYKSVDKQAGLVNYLEQENPESDF